MKKLIAILMAVALGTGVGAAIVWACCGTSKPLTISNITGVPEELPCDYEGQIEICFDISFKAWGNDWTNSTYARVLVNGVEVGMKLVWPTNEDISNYPSGPGGTEDAPGVEDTRNKCFIIAIPGPGIYDITLQAYDGAVVSESIELVVAKCVDVDIKGGSCPNALNRGNKGVTPVAILAPAAALVDPDSVTVGGVAVIPGMSIWEDSTAPPTGDPTDCDDCFEAIDVDGDGAPDNLDGVAELVVYVDTQELVAGPNGLAAAVRDQCVVLDIGGLTTGGVPIVGADSVLIKK